MPSTWSLCHGVDNRHMNLAKAVCRVRCTQEYQTATPHNAPTAYGWALFFGRYFIMANNNRSATKVVIPCRISFANIWEPKSINGSDEKYSVSCIIPKSDKATLAKIHKAIEAAKEDGKSRKWGGKIPANLKLPLRDGDVERADDEAYADAMYVNANSKDAPQIVDRKVQPILDAMECGSGDYCNVSVNFYAFNANGNRGVAAGLGNIQLIKHGERLAGKASAASDFEEIEGEEDAAGAFGGEDDLPDYLK